MEKDTYIVATVGESFEGVRVFAATAPDKALANRHSRGQIVLPVAVVREPRPGLFTELFGHPVPSDIPMWEGALLFAHSTMDAKLLVRHLRRLTPARSIPLLRRWQGAVYSASGLRSKEVAP